MDEQLVQGRATSKGERTSQVYDWRKQLLASADAVFTPKRERSEDRRIEKLAAENTRMAEAPARTTSGSYYVMLPAEGQAIWDYTLGHPEVRHRELAWKMLDDDVCAVSSSSV